MLLKRRLWPLFTAVFAGNFSDYYLKSAFISHIAFVAFASPSVRNTLIILSPVLLILPFLLFPSFIASFADHYPKAKQMRWNKLFALGIMLFSAFCFLYNILGGILVSLFLIGIEMTYLGPLKFAILPYHFKDEELLKANSILNSGSFVAIFAGALAGNYSVVLPDAEKWIALVLIIGGVIGYLASLLIPFSGRGSDLEPLTFHPIRSTVALLKEVWRNRPIRKAILSNSWFWFFCTWYFSYIPLLVRDGLQGDPHILNFVLLSFMGGIWLGSMSISWLKKTHLLKACRPLLLLGALGSFGIAWVQYAFHNAFDFRSLTAVMLLFSSSLLQRGPILFLYSFLSKRTLILKGLRGFYQVKTFVTLFS